jgi:hypothetical protein
MLHVKYDHAIILPDIPIRRDNSASACDSGAPDSKPYYSTTPTTPHARA